MEPYIGVTGFTKPQEVDASLRFLPTNPSRKLMIGVLASSKTLRGDPLKPYWAPRYPPPKDICLLFRKDPRTLNLVHFSTDAVQPSTLYDELLRIVDLGGPNLHGVQLNMAWPNRGVLEMVKAQCDLSLVLQVGSTVIHEFHQNSTTVVDRIRGYDGTIHSILLDPSGGKGRPFNPEELQPILRLLNAGGRGIGVAGGLGPNTLPIIEPLLKEFPHVSIDAEGLLRNDASELDLHRVQTYLDRAFTLFS